VGTTPWPPRGLDLTPLTFSPGEHKVQFIGQLDMQTALNIKRRITTATETVTSEALERVSAKIKCHPNTSAHVELINANYKRVLCHSSTYHGYKNVF
jgi:hypothetical protein